jgi:hypothetical protein
VIEARGQDRRGNGTATARVIASFAGDEQSTDVELLTDLAITGKPAQFGPGVISDASDKLLDQFASNVSGRLAEGLGIPVEVIEPIDSLNVPSPWVDDEGDNERTIEMEAVRVDAGAADGTEAAEATEQQDSVAPPTRAEVPEPEPAIAPVAGSSPLAVLGALRRYAPAIGLVIVVILFLLRMINRRRNR